MRARLLLVNHALISVFGVASGLFKVAQGAPDLSVFSHLGMGPAAVSIFGAIQVLSTLASWPLSTRRWGAVGLALCNALATVGLFAAAVQPFGIVSTVMVLMAIAVLLRPVSKA